MSDKPIAQVRRGTDDDGRECFRVWVKWGDGKRITTPLFNSRGAAQTYADLIRSGYRKPEFAREP